MIEKKRHLHERRGFIFREFRQFISSVDWASRTGEIASLRLIKVERNPLDFGIADLSEPVHSSGFALRNRIFKCNVFAQIT